MGKHYLNVLSRPSNSEVHTFFFHRNTKTPPIDENHSSSGTALAFALWGIDKQGSVAPN